MRMKNKSLCLLCIVFMLMLTACDPPPPVSIPISELEGQVSKVELIHYENPKQKSYRFWDMNHSKQLKPFNDDNDTVIAELPPERIPELLNRVSAMELIPGLYPFDSPKCLCLRLTFIDDSFMIINCDEHDSLGYVGTYSNDGEVLDYIGSPNSIREYADIIGDFFDIYIT